jgi:methionyl-tRNA formyltransferase
VGSTYFSKNSINFNHVEINTNDTAFAIHNQIRAFSFIEYQLPEINGRKIDKSKIISSRSLNKPGELMFLGDNEAILSTIDYEIEISFTD